MPVLMIVSPHDRHIYEAVLNKSVAERHIAQLVLAASVDMVNEAMWSTRDMYLKIVDRFNDQSVSAFVTALNYRFLLLHDGRHDDGVKPFFQELYELFLKVVLNPLRDPGEPIQSKVFHDRVSSLARKHLL